MNQSIRKTVAAFASLFKDIPLHYYDDSGNLTQSIKVPIIYSDKEKYVKRVQGDPDSIDSKVQISLPRIEYGLLNYSYDPTRRLNQANKITACNGSNNYVSPPVPYIFNFELVIYTRNIEEANQITEYILPFFYPDYNLSVNLAPDSGIMNSIPFMLINTGLDQDSTGYFDSPVRSVYRTLNFSAKSYIYQQNTKTIKPILQAETYIYTNHEVQEFNYTANNGVFKVDDIVFQGTSFERALAKGKVTAYTNTYISIQTTQGTFTENVLLKNVINTANCILGTVGTGLVLSSIITPTPNTYPPGLFTYNYNITDYTT